METPDHLRHVDVDGFTLRTWDTNRRDSLGKWILGYEFKDPKGETLFQGEDFGCSPMHAVDSDETLRAILGFLTLRPGDTDREYFERYTAAQRDFAATEAESLQIWSLEGDDIDLPAFRNLDDWEGV
jgi:hypothetical protein